MRDFIIPIVATIIIMACAMFLLSGPTLANRSYTPPPLTDVRVEAKLNKVLDNQNKILKNHRVFDRRLRDIESRLNVLVARQTGITPETGE